MIAGLVLFGIGMAALFGLGLIWWAVEEWVEIDDPHIYYADDDHGGKYGN